MTIRRLTLVSLALLLSGLTKPGPGSGAAPPEAPATKATTPKALIERAVKSAQADNLSEAITLLEDAIKIEPKNRTALYLLSAMLQGRAHEEDRPKSDPYYLKSAQVFRQLRAAYPDLREDETNLYETVLYNEACTYAVEGKADKALDALAEAVAAGLSRSAEVNEDKELDSLRKLPRYQELEKKIAQNATTKARAEARKRLAEGTPFKFGFKLPDLDGKTIALADSEGKVTIVDVWGTWCPPCRREIPHFVDLYRKYHEKGLEIVGINYERVPKEEVKETIREFVKEFKIPYPCVLGDDKTQEMIPDFEGFPTTLFVDRAGTVRAKIVGFDPDSAMVLEEIVTTLLAEAPSKAPARP